MKKEELQAMSLENFKEALPYFEGTQILEADGSEVYGLYKHDVCYMERDGIERTLQMIVPEFKEDTGKTLPAILYVQGSAWMKQDQYKRLGVMARLAQKGYVTAILQYRESALATFPAQIEDAKTGIRFLRKNAAEYHIDPSKVFLMGDSSGGNTAFITAFTADEDMMDAKIYEEYSCKVNAVVDLYGVSDVRIKEDFPTTLNQGEPDSPEGMLIGGKNVYEYPELSDPITCANYVREEVPSPPIMMMHGEADTLVSCNQSLRLYKKLLEAGKDVMFYLVKNAVHGDVAFWTQDNVERIDAFFKKHM